MAYNKTIWKDQDVENPRTYTVQDNSDGTKTFFDAFGNVTEIGTPVNATNMNKIETEIEDLETNKANKNLDNVDSAIDYVIERSDPSILPSWWRIWKSGKLEQGGDFGPLAANTFTAMPLLKEFATNLYYFNAMPFAVGGASHWVINQNRATSTTTTVELNSNTNGLYFSWKAIGVKK